MDPIYELFLKHFQAENLDECRELINQPEFDVNHIYTQKELKTRLLNFPIDENLVIDKSTITLNVMQLIARLGKKWASPLIQSVLELEPCVGGGAIVVDLDLQNCGGWTALMMAACHSTDTSSLETLETLIRARVNLNLRNADGYSALILAVTKFYGNMSSRETIELLILAGANIDLQDKYGYTALMHTVFNPNNKSSLQTVELLI